MSNVEASTIWPQVVTGVFAIAGGISSGLFVWLTSRQTLAEQRKVAIEQKKLERLEELYVLFEAWTNDLFSVYLVAVQRHKGILTAKDENDAMVKRRENSSADFKRLVMIIDIHAPELKESWAKVLEIRDKNSKFLLSKESQDLKDFLKNERELHSLCEVFKKALADLSRR